MIEAILENKNKAVNNQKNVWKKNAKCQWPNTNPRFFIKIIPGFFQNKRTEIGPNIKNIIW